MVFEKLASAIRNNVVSGLRGYHTAESFTLEQIEDDIVDVRLQLITQLAQQGVLPLKDLLLEINCIPVDCKNIEKCFTCKGELEGTPTMHFEIPQVYFGTAGNYISYIGSPDKQNPFLIYTSPKQIKMKNYRRRKVTSRPYVFVDTTPNENGFYDCWVYNAPLLKRVTIVALFKDPRQLCNYDNCNQINNDDNLNPLNNEIKKLLTEQYLRYYRQGAMPILQNDQTPQP